jgi:hypothetical protein
MKTNKLKTILLLPLLMAMACEQEVLTTTAADPDLTNTVVPEPCPAGATAGSASFTKFIAIGNSFVAGVQGGALFTTAQNNSLPAILNKQFQCVGASATFNQPSINASLGWNLFVTQPFLTDNTKPILGRMLLQYSGATSPKPNPQAYAPGNLEALPNPSANPGFMYTGSKTALNNFGVPAIVLGQSLISQTGNWSLAGTDPRFQPFYGRFASAPGTSTIIGDAAAAGGSFFLFWLGLDDFFLHAAFGGDPTKAPLTVANGGGPTNFDFQYTAAITSLLSSNANLKGVVGNFPDIFKMPHFTSVVYNPIPLDAATATAVTAGLATPYNGIVNAAYANGIITAEERDKRLLTYAAGNNKILLTDETLTDLTAFMNGAGAGALVPYARARQTTSADIIPLSTGSVLGVGGAGVNVPVADQYVLIPSEITAINNARIAYNAIVAGVVSANSTKLALADIDATMSAFVTAQVYYGPDYNGLTLTPNINPPTGIYSEDGAHFNTRGYAFISRTFITAINAKFGATIPLTNLAHYNATGLPIP